MSEKFPDRMKVPVSLWISIKASGISVTELLRKSQLPLAVFSDQAAISYAQYLKLWHTIGKITDTPLTGIKLSASLPTDKYPPALLAAYHAQNYGSALLRLERYSQLCSPDKLFIHKSGDRCAIELKIPTQDASPPATLIEAHLATLLEIGRRGTGRDIKASHLELAIPKKDASEYQRYFGCPVKFNAGQNCLYLSSPDLELPFQSYNAELLEFLTPVLDKKLTESHPARSFGATVAWLLAQRLSAGQPNMLEIAQELGVSERTLQRRLNDEGTRFNQLLNEVRRSRSHELLADLSLDITEVTLLLGYEDQSSFFRAFKSWENTTPAQWRATQQPMAHRPDNSVPIS